MGEEENRCSMCGKSLEYLHCVSCDMCGDPLCEECGSVGLCSTCAELWESEIDLADMEASEE